MKHTILSRGGFPSLVLIAAGALGCQGKERPFADTVPGSGGTDGNPMAVGLGGSDPGGVGASPPSACEGSACASSPEQIEPVGGLSGTGIDPTQAAAGSSDAGVDSPCVDGATESCGPVAEEGTCKFGARTCTAGAWGECVGAVFGGPRDCSSSDDNDCDGQPDDTLDDVCRCPVGGTQPCDEHPELDGRGPCHAGIQACVLGVGNASSDWGACTGSVGPEAADSCDVAQDDSNCDGTPNGGCNCVEGESQPCGPQTDTGACAFGTSVCMGGGFSECMGAVIPARRDCRSPQDNDCDGLADNTPDATCACTIGTTQACATHPGRDGNGPCRAGSQLCVAGAQNASSSFGACTGSVGPAQRDSCTTFGDDADCNGTPNSGCQCVAGRGNQPCSGNPNNSRCNSQGQCAPCQSNADCSLVSGGRNLCTAGVCAAPRCGDGIVQPGIGETCDDGNTVSGDGCSKGCVAGQAPRGGTSFASTHLCVVLPSGVVSCWGLNSSGQLGTGSTSTTLERPTYASGITTAVDVALHGNNTCAARANGSVACWGSTYGSRPVDVVGVTGVTQLAGGMSGFCGRQTSGRVTCWTTSSDAAQVNGVDSIVQVARGDRHNCVLRNDGALFCQGGGTEGELGQGLIGPFADTFIRSTVFNDVVQVATGYRSTCVRTRSSGLVQCVGDDITTGSPLAIPGGNAAPITPLNLPNAVKIVASEQHMCALTEDEEVRCWGVGLAAGNGDPSGSVTPFAVSLPGPAIDVGAGSFTSCALLSDTSIYCWGNFAPTAASSTPARITFP